MAFAFFRRRQKMVIIIMVVLMISFLVGMQGFKQLLDRRGGKDKTIGDSRFGELTHSRWARAGDELKYLQALGLSNPFRGGELEFVYLLAANASDAQTAYALLGQEADAMGVKVLSGQIDAWFNKRGLVGEDLDAFVTQLREHNQTITAERLRQIVGGWLAVRQAFASARTAAPPSQVQVKRLYRDLNEKINLRLAAITAADLTDQVDEPSDDEIVSQFNAYREQAPGRYSQDNSFGFGYLQPDRAEIRYLFISRQAVERVSQPDERAVEDYYLENMAEFVREVPAPDGQAASAPATQPAKTEQMSFTEARPQIVQTLREQFIADHMDDLAGEALNILNSLSKDEWASGKPYEIVEERLVSPAEDLLGRRTGRIDIEAEPLERAVAVLAEAAGVQIAYPWGEQGEYKIDPAIAVTLQVGDASLGEALAAVTRQIPGVEPLEWVRYAVMGGAVFSAGPARMLPVSTGGTGMIDEAELQADPILAYSVSDPGQLLAALVFSSKAFGGEGNLAVGEEGPKMRVLGAKGGVLLWRLARAKASYALDAIDSADDLDEPLRRQVVQDVKTERAFALAKAKADVLRAAAAETGLKAAAEAQQIETFETDLFARKTHLSPRKMAMQRMMWAGRTGPDAIIRSLLEAPHSFEFTRVPGVALPDEAAREAFIEAAFALAPANVDPPYPSESALDVIPVPSRAQVLVAERIGFVPAVQAEYDRPGQDRPSGRAEMLAALVEMQQWQEMVAWFDLDNIVERTGYKLRPEPPQPAEEVDPPAQVQAEGEPAEADAEGGQAAE